MIEQHGPGRRPVAARTALRPESYVEHRTAIPRESPAAGEASQENRRCDRSVDRPTLETLQSPWLEATHAQLFFVLHGGLAGILLDDGAWNGELDPAPSRILSSGTRRCRAFYCRIFVHWQVQLRAFGGQSMGKTICQYS